MKLKNKVALITGGGRGIGRATAILFAKEGAQVVVSDIDLKEGRETVALINATCGEASFVQADVSKAAEAKRMVETAVEKYGRLDVLFNNAGIELTGKVEEMPEDAWDRVLDVNLKGVFLCSKYAIPQMLKQGGGTIINAGSTAGLFGLGEEGAYCASKGGVIVLTKSMAMDYAAKNIRVNCICPGSVETRLTPSTPAVIKNIPMGRIGQPEDVAKIALLFASDQASFVTGATLVVDGGGTAGYTRSQLDGVKQ